MHNVITGPWPSPPSLRDRVDRAIWLLECAAFEVMPTRLRTEIVAFERAVGL